MAPGSFSALRDKWQFRRIDGKLKRSRYRDLSRLATSRGISAREKYNKCLTPQAGEENTKRNEGIRK